MKVYPYVDIKTGIFAWENNKKSKFILLIFDGLRTIFDSDIFEK